jgi:predicted AlkP superfamily pyrophosphatase or phosphodiesterase
MPAEYPMTALAPTIAACLGLPAPARATEPPLAAIVEALSPVRRLAVVAPDALGLAIVNRWSAELPYLVSLLDRRRVTLRSVMPTITPVNFATMVTGATPDVHGIATFRDDFACETLFDVVRVHGGLSAGVGQKGYTGSELLGRSADFWGKAESNLDEEVETIALDFAAAQAPQFLIVQLGSTDDALHAHGPSSELVVPKLRETDARLSRMVERLTALDYAVIITADHGQHDTETGGSHGTPSDEDALVPCTWVASASAQSA